MQINYEQPTIAFHVGSTTVSSVETILMTLTNEVFTRQAELAAYFNLTMGSASGIAIKYYFTPDAGTTWYLPGIKNTTTGSYVAVSTSLAGSGMEVIRIPAQNGIKITATANAIGTLSPVLNSLSVFVRDN